MTNEVKINVPEGYEIDEENSTFECIKFKPIKNELPKTWEEFCKSYKLTRNEYFISDNSELKNTLATSRHPIYDTNILPNIETAEAMVALCQLIQLRDCYNNGWVPDWRNDFQSKYTIYHYLDGIGTSCTNTAGRILAFKTRELRDQFLKNFNDLIETAKPLL